MAFMRMFSTMAMAGMLAVAGCRDETPVAEAGEMVVRKIPSEIQIFDTTLYLNKPAKNGLSRKMQMLYPNFMGIDLHGTPKDLRPGTRDADLRFLLDQAEAMGTEYVVLDIEGAYGTDKTVEASMRRLVLAARTYKPKMKYGCCYIPATYPAGSAHQGTLQQVQAANNALASTIALMDFMVPEAYLHDDPAKGAAGHAAWLAYMRMGIAESRRMAPGKPVFPMLELTLADYGWAGPMTAEGPVPLPLLLGQLNATLAEADGVILWGAIKANPNGSFMKWDPYAPWYVAMLHGRLLNLGPEAQNQLDKGLVPMAVHLNAAHPGK